MRRPSALLPALAAVLGGATAAHAASEISYEDLRVQVGSACNQGEALAFTFVAGDLGDKDQGVMDFGSDFGLVLGLRVEMARVPGAVQVVNPGSDIALNLLGGELLGGFGYYVGKNDIVEFLVGFSIGISSEAGQTAFNHRDGRYTGYSAEFGWYHTFGRSNFEVGAVVGVERVHDSFALGSGDTFPVRAQGFDAALVFGYRFH
jgi:hypothetical protein